MDSEEKDRLTGLTEIKGLMDTTMAADYGAHNYRITDYQINVNDPLTFQEIDLNSISHSLNLSNGGTGTSLGGVGAAGSNIWTTTTSGTGGYNWGTIGTGTGPSIQANGEMHLNGENADIRINGKSLSAWMEQVEQRLNILTPNPKLEQEWDQLRRLGERYRKLEKQCQEKAEMWNKLKSMPPVKVK